MDIKELSKGLKSSLKTDFNIFCNIMKRLMNYCTNDKISDIYISNNIVKRPDGTEINMLNLHNEIKKLMTLYIKVSESNKNYNKISSDLINNLPDDVRNLRNILPKKSSLEKNEDSEILTNIPMKLQIANMKFEFDLYDVFLCGKAKYNKAKLLTVDAFMKITQEYFLEPIYIVGNITMFLDFLMYGNLQFIRNLHHNDNIKSGFYIVPESFSKVNSMDMIKSLDFESLFDAILEDGELKSDFTNPDGSINMSKITEVLVDIITSNSVSGRKFFNEKENNKGELSKKITGIVNNIIPNITDIASEIKVESSLE